MRRMALVISSILPSAVLTARGGRNESPPSASPSPARQTSMGETPSISPSTAPGTQGVGSQIVISNMAYTVPPSVSPGQELTIVNKDELNHTVTADENNLFDIRCIRRRRIDAFHRSGDPRQLCISLQAPRQHARGADRPIGRHTFGHPIAPPHAGQRSGPGTES